MIRLKKSRLIFFVRALFVLLIGVLSYFTISYTYTSQQEVRTIGEAENAMNYAHDLLNNLGTLSTKDQTLYAGNTNLTEHELVSHVREFTGFGCTIFKGDTRISTTASEKGSNAAAIGTQSNSEIATTVFGQGNTFKGITKTIGKDWLIIYEPLTTISGERVGMLAVFVEHDLFLAQLIDFKLIVALVLFLFLAIVLVIMWNSYSSKRQLKKDRYRVLENNDELRAQKEELQELIFVVEEIEQAIAIIGTDDRIQWVNKSFTNSLLYSNDEAVGRKVSDIVGGPKTDRNVIAQMDEAIFKKKEPIDTIVLQYRKDGTSYWARVYLTPLLNDKGDLDKYVAISLDITPEKNALDRLKESEANIRQIGETIDDLVYLYNIEEKRYEYMSPKCLSVLGADQDYFYSGNKRSEHNIIEEDKSILNEALEDVKRGVNCDIQYRIRVNGLVRWIRERSFPIINAEGKILKYSGICSDITENKRMITQLNRSHKNMQVLADMGLEITEELSIVKIIEIVHTQIRQVMEISGFAVGIINRDNQTLTFPKFIENEAVYENITHSLDEHILATLCVKNDQDIIINDIVNEIGNYTDKKLEHTPGSDPESLIYLPLKFKDEIMGVITVQSIEMNAYDKHQIELLRSLSVYISNALVNARLYESLEQKVKERTAEVLEQKEKLERNYHNTKILSQIGLDIAASVKFDPIFEKLYENVNSLIDAEVFGIRIYNEKQQTIDHYYEMESGERMEKLQIPANLKNNYTVWCIRDRKALMINDNEKEYAKYVEEIVVPKGKKPHSLLFCPIIVDERIIGVITAQSFKKNAYEQKDLDILKTLAFYSGMALNNSWLYETLEAKVEERTRELSLKNREILDSINYAKHIQYATLTSERDRLQLLPESFVFYKPKDIVSGDFYRVDTIKTQDDRNLISFVVADCTGHGVPGASLAILCSSIIKQSLSEHSVYSPSEALDFACEQLRVFLQSSESTIYDGMDLAFCVLNTNDNLLYFSGAFANCIIVRNDEEHILRGDRKHVGYQENRGVFTNIEFQLEHGDLVYLTTDGYIDQFGGPNDRKFTRKKFLSLIHDIKELEMGDQHEKIKTSFDSWKGENEQTDDICVMGVRIV